MEIFVQPGPTGDIQTLLLSQDTISTVFLITHTGTFLGPVSVQTASYPVCRLVVPLHDVPVGSGFNRKGILEETLINNLASCYCINNSCGNNLVFNNDMVIKTIGGGWSRPSIGRTPVMWSVM